MEYTVDEYNCAPLKKTDGRGSGARYPTYLAKYKTAGRCVANESSSTLPNRKSKKRRVPSLKPRREDEFDEVRPLLQDPENPAYASSTCDKDLQSSHAGANDGFYRKCMHFLFPNSFAVSGGHRQSITDSARLASGDSSTSTGGTKKTFLSAKRTQPLEVENEIFVRSRLGYNVTQIYFPESGQIFKPK